MQCILTHAEHFVIRFDEGEELLTGMIKFCNERSITAGTFTAIGQSREVMLSYYDLPEKKYKDQHFQKDMEIVGMQGNIGRVDEATIIHAHGSFSDGQFNVWAGHIKRMVVSATAEVSLTVLPGPMIRVLDEKTVLRLLISNQPDGG